MEKSSCRVREMRQKKKEKSNVKGTRSVLAGGEDGGRHQGTRNVWPLNVGNSCQRETKISALQSKGTESCQ